MKKYLFLLAIVILAIYLRLYRIDNPVADWHSWRQADTASVSDYYLKNGIDLFVPKYHDISDVPNGRPNPEGYRMVEFPLYNAAHATLAKNFPIWNLDRWGRTLSVGLSIVSLVFFFLILEFLSGTTTAFIGAFLFAVLPFNIFFSRVILPEPLVIALLLSGTYFFLKLTKKPTLINYLLSSSLLALSLLIKPYALFFFLPLALFAYTRFKLKLLLSPLTYIYLLIVFAPLYLWRQWILNYPAGIPSSGWLYNAEFIRFRPAWFRWLFGERLSRLILGYFGLYLFIEGLLNRPKKSENWFYHLWFVGVLAYFSVFAAGNVRHDYYQALIVPVIVALLAVGLSHLLRPSIHRIWPLSPIIAVFSVGMMLFLSWYQVRDYYQINNPAIIHAGEAVDKLLPQDAKVIAPYNGDTAFLYQTKRRGWPLVTTNVETLIKEGATHYVSVTYDPFTAKLMTQKWVEVLEKNPEFVILKLNRP